MSPEVRGRPVSGRAGENTQAIVDIGLAVSGLVYLLLSRSLKVTAEQSAIEASERELRVIDVAAGEQLT